MDIIKRMIDKVASRKLQNRMKLMKGVGPGSVTIP